MGEKTFDYEKALKQLEKITEQLEDENTPLEKSIELFTQGKSLAAQCMKKLTEMEQKVQVLLENDKGEPEVQDFEPGVEPD